MVTYSLSDLTKNGATQVVAESVNNSGEIVGEYQDLSGGSHAFYFINGQLTTIDGQGSNSSAAVDVNNLGQVLVEYDFTNNNGNPDRSSFVLDGNYNKQFIVISGGKFIDVQSINDYGQVSGAYNDSSGVRDAFIETGNNIITINVSPDHNAKDTFFDAVDINNRGQALINYDDASGVTQTFIYTSGQPTKLTLAGATSINGTAINDQGTVAGSLIENNELYAFVEDNGQYQTYALPTAVFARLKINNSGVADGYYEDQNSQYHGFAIKDGVLTIVSDSSHSQTAFLGINDAGELVGTSINNSLETGLVATPADPTPGDDNIVGTSGPDTVSLLAGNDRYSGLDGNDVVYGNQGNDLVYGNGGDDTIFGGMDQDTAYGGMGNDVIYGNKGDDVAYGNLGNDTLFGGMGNDTLYGGMGDDVLFGNKGDDVLVGGLGADTFAFNPGDTDFRSMLGTGDTIADFMSGTDNIDFTAGPAATAQNFGSAATTATDFASIQALAQSLINNGDTYAFVADGRDGFLFTTGGTGTTIADAVKLSGAGTQASLKYQDVHGGAVA